ncbi:aspartate aminotransferase family protein [Pontivivens nitratireducens]|uniref:Acetylornithine aminotransferase n=1 Tax=Pontivivens nitratireducens TaxID=2758038 RepID=A0A6G7VHA3_9RHOB|nr:aspartate aminotransferase family protein [Pontibrevibacter nitratireducens]QIK39429.1 aspartate aminotransferase family protein [Pontibrevibacter nitratireducens]
MITPVLPTYARAPLSFVEGEGPWLMTEDATRYLDMGAGIAVAALGHSHPRLIEALETQGRRLWHTSNLYEIPNQTKLAEMLVERTFADTVFFTNSGTEATEAAVKMARKYHHAKETGRDEIITFNGSFHGRTLGMISAAGAEKLTKGFGPLLPGFVHVPFGDHDALHAAINDRTAAIMIEPVQGEGGILPVPDQCLQGLRKLCDEQGILLIYDEIQCGMGRTGKLFAHEWSGATPDIMAVAKGIGGGFPLGACLATEEAAIGMTAGTHGTTYGGNPLACAVGCAVMEVMAEDGFMEHVSRVSGHLRQGLDSLVARFPDVFELVRGSGLMIGVKCVVPNGEVVAAGYDHKLLTVPGGDNVIRILPPLIVTTQDVDEALRRLEAAATDLSGRAA